MMNLVYVRFPRTTADYLFEVPVGTYLNEGQVVFVQNKSQRTPTQVVCSTDSFLLPEKTAGIIIREIFGTFTKPLSKVVGLAVPTYTMVSL